ncbi:MAG TPA: carboxypeptidase regulatory-like domain-containing protein [Niastella sp.]
MSDHKEHISHYSAADIQRYVQGKLSAAEMHAMEKAALDDPFLADAMEGMQQAFDEHKESVVTGQLQQLQQQFNARTNRTARVIAFKPFRYWQAAAAAAVVLIIAGVWMFNIDSESASDTQSAPVIAKTEEPQPSASVTPPVTENKNTGADTVSAAPAEVTANTHRWHNENNKLVTEKVKKPSPKTEDTYRYSTTTGNAPVRASGQELNNPEKYFPKPEKKEVLAADRKEAAPENKISGAPVADNASPYAGNRSAAVAKALEAKTAQEREPETELITIARNDVKAKRAPAKDKNLSGVIKGQVTDPFNNPVANAYVQVQLQKSANNQLLNNLTTDKRGYFKIPASDSTVNVAIKLSGYGTQNFTLQNNAAVNQLQLQPANYSYNNFEQIAQVNNKKQQAGSYKFPNVMLYDAEPAYGWVAFGQYLEKNKIVPAGAESVTGNVIVSFEVNKKGMLSDFKIEQSLSKAHDEEAIRLIKQGPSWKLLSGRKGRVTVMVKF